MVALAGGMDLLCGLWVVLDFVEGLENGDSFSVE